MALLGSEQNQNRHFVQKSKFLFSSEDYWKYQHSGNNCQEESRKNIFFLYIYSENSKWKWKWKDVLQAFFLTVVTIMPVYPVVSDENKNCDACTKFRFWFCSTPRLCSPNNDRPNVDSLLGRSPNRLGPDKSATFTDFKCSLSPCQCLTLSHPP